ncbi:TPA: hypothetical protein JLJ14_004554 [Escherichia coli]|nr:hypothetical protein [Escherichia coli]
MKKTLIALAMAASAVVSGSVIAADWEASGSGGSFEMGGTLTMISNLTPWEVKVGAAVNNLDATIEKGGNTVSIPVNTTIPVLSIRTNQREFVKVWGASPQINYGGFTPNSDMSEAGLGMLTLDVTNEDGEHIGKVKIPLTVGAVGTSSTGRAAGLMAPQEGDVFWGGLATSEGMSLTYNNVLAKINAIDPETILNYQDGTAGTTDSSIYSISPSDDGQTYNAAYVSGIESGKSMIITFNDAIKPGTITWKASLPVTVSYA